MEGCLNLALHCSLCWALVEVNLWNETWLKCANSHYHYVTVQCTLLLPWGVSVGHITALWGNSTLGRAVEIKDNPSNTDQEKSALIMDWFDTLALSVVRRQRKVFLHSGSLTSPDMQQQLWREVKPQVFTSTQSNQILSTKCFFCDANWVDWKWVTSVAHYTDFKSRPF